MSAHNGTPHHPGGGGNGGSSYGCKSVYDATHQRVLLPRSSIHVERTRVVREAQPEAGNGARPCGDRTLLREVRSAARACADAPSSTSRGLRTRPTVFLDAESPATHARHTRRARRHTSDIGSGLAPPGAACVDGGRGSGGVARAERVG